MAAAVAVAGAAMRATAAMATAATTRRPARSGPDRTSVILFTLAAFFCVLALLAHQLRASAQPVAKHPRPIVVRRVYRTTVVETVPGPASGTSVSRSVSSSGTGASSSGSGQVPPTPAPTTRASG